MINFKPILLILSFLIPFHGFEGENLDVLSINNIKEIKIIYVNWQIVTSHSVSCERFEHAFQKSLKEKNIINKSSIDSLKDFVITTKQKNKYLKSVDTRFKMIIFKDNNENNDTVCGNTQGIHIKGKNYLISNEFSDYIKELLE